MKKVSKEIEVNTWPILTDLERGRYVAGIIDRFKTFALDRAIMGMRDASESGHDFVMDELALFVQIETGGNTPSKEDGLIHYTPPAEGLSYKQACTKIRSNNDVSIHRPNMQGMYIERYGVLLYQDAQGGMHPASMHLTYEDMKATDWKVSYSSGDHHE